MKVGILAGGLGTRLSEETAINPKPMVQIGGLPILWHIMQIYAAAGHREFVVALGYKGDVIKEYFTTYRRRTSRMSVNLATGNVGYWGGELLDWQVHLLDTGLFTMTGGRIKQLAEFADGTFMLTYGDGVADVDIDALLAFHKSHGKLATVTVVRPPARFGNVQLEGNRVLAFDEKPQLGEGWINGGYFVLEPGIMDYINGTDCVWEREPMERLAEDGQLMAFQHDGFWQCMDTMRDVKYLNELWEQDSPAWKVWK